MGLDYFNFWQNLIEHIVCIICTTRAPPTNDINGSGIGSGSSRANDEDPPHQLMEKPGHSYAVERIVHHRRTKDWIRYHLRCYGYEPADDTHGLASHIPTHLIDCYWGKPTHEKCSLSKEQKRQRSKRDREWLSKGRKVPNKPSKAQHKPEKQHPNNLQAQPVRSFSRLQNYRHIMCDPPSVWRRHSASHLQQETDSYKPMCVLLESSETRVQRVWTG